MTDILFGTAGWHYFAGERLASFLSEGEVIDDLERFSQLKHLYETS